MIRHLSYVVCDSCGDPAQPAADAADARLLARDEGYRREGGRDLCSACDGSMEFTVNGQRPFQPPT